MTELKGWVVAIGLVLSLFGALWGIFFAIGRATDPGPRPTPVYANGDFVQSVLSGQRGQVVGAYCYKGARACFYSVRFIGLSITTNTSMLGPDGPVSTEPLSAVDMQEFELTPYKGA